MLLDYPEYKKNAQKSSKLASKPSGKTLTESVNSAIFIGGIPKQADKDELVEYLSQFGDVVNISMPFRGVQSNHKGFAKVLLSSGLDTYRFLSCPEHLICNMKIGASRWVSKLDHVSLKEAPTENKLFIRIKGNLSESELLEYFRCFGKVESIEIKLNYRTGQLRDIGFVTFENPESAALVVEKGENHQVHGSKVLVQFSMTKRDLAKAFKQSQNIKSVQSLHSKDEDKCQPLKHTSKRQKPFINESRKIGTSKEAYQFQASKSRHPSLNTSLHQQMSKMRKNDTPVSGNVGTSGTIGIHHVSPFPQNRLYQQHLAKPCSSRWHHPNVSKNHAIDSNLVFRIVRMYPDHQTGQNLTYIDRLRIINL